MSKLPEYFQQTCDKPYNRHQYRLFYVNGNEKLFDCWEDVHRTWFETSNQFLSHIEVLDKKQSKGFK